MDENGTFYSSLLKFCKYVLDHHRCFPLLLHTSRPETACIHIMYAADLSRIQCRTQRTWPKRAFWLADGFIGNRSSGKRTLIFFHNFKHHFALLLVTLTQKWFGNVKSPWIWATPPVSEGIWINLHTSIWLMLDSSKKSISAKLINVVLSSDWHLNKSKKKKKRSASNWDRKRERVHKQELCLLIHHKYADR